MPIINDENGKKSEHQSKYRKKDRKGIFTEEERKFLRWEASCQRNDDICHNKKYVIRVKAKKAFKEDLPLILKNLDWIFDDDEDNDTLQFFEKRLFENIRAIYFIKRDKLKQERLKAKVKSTVAQKEIWKRVNDTIKEGRNKARQFCVECEQKIPITNDEKKQAI
jgi:hypothetical protein